MRVRFSVVFVASAMILAACAASPTPPVSEPPGPHLTVQAHDIAYDTKTLTMTAKEPTQIFFLNHDTGVPHNVAISLKPGDPPSLFDGELISQGAIVYDVPALDAGTYHFYCTVHPNMNGTVQVTP